MAKLTPAQRAILEKMRDGAEIRYVVGIPSRLYDAKNERLNVVSRPTLRALEVTGLIRLMPAEYRLGPAIWHITDRGHAALETQEVKYGRRGSSRAT